jgi:hypothetical protein
LSGDSDEDSNENSDLASSNEENSDNGSKLISEEGEIDVKVALAGTAEEQLKVLEKIVLETKEGGVEK